MSKKGIIFRYVKKFLLSILIFITTLVVLTRVTILNRTFVEKQFSSEHYKKVEEALKTKMKDSMISSGIDSAVIDTMFTEVDVKKTNTEMLDIIFNYNKQSINTDSIRSQLEENVKADLVVHNYEITDMEGYQQFIDSMMDIYEGEFKMLGKLTTLGEYMQKIIKVFTIATIMLSSITLIIIAARYKKMPKYLPTALFTTSFLILFGGRYIYNQAGLGSIMIISSTFSEVLRKIINSTFNTFYLVSYLYIVVGIGLCLLVRKHRHRHHHRHHN